MNDSRSKDIVSVGLENILHTTISATSWELVASNPSLGASFVLAKQGTSKLKGSGKPESSAGKVGTVDAKGISGSNYRWVTVGSGKGTSAINTEVLAFQADIGMGFVLEGRIGFGNPCASAQGTRDASEIIQMVVPLAAAQLSVIDIGWRAEALSQLVGSLSVSGVVANGEGEVIFDLWDGDDVPKESETHKFLTGLTRLQIKRAIEEANSVLSLGRAGGVHFTHTKVRDRNNETRVVFILPLKIATVNAPENSLFAILVPERTKILTAAALKDAYSLTPAEAKVVKKILAGTAIKQVAEDLNLSEHTVRTYLKRCFAKIGVHNQPQMINRVNSLSVPLRG